MMRHRLPRVKSDKKDEFFCVSWVDQNKYSTLHVSRIPGYSPDNHNQDIVGQVLNFKWTDGEEYLGEVVKYGTRAEMLEEEEQLEKQAADLSFVSHGDNEPDKFYAVVNWQKDGKLSVLSSDKLNVDEWTDKENLVGKNVHGKWKGEWLPVIIMAIGSKDQMKAELAGRCATGSVAKKKKAKEVAANHAQQEQTDDQLEKVVVDIEAYDKDKLIADLKEQVNDLKRKFANEEARCKRFRRLLKKGESVSLGSNEVDIGGGITIPKDVDDFSKLAFQSSPMKFLKSILVKGGIFSLEELASHSLKGGKFPRSGETCREMLDPVKLKAAFDYTIACLKLNDDPYRKAKFEVNLKDLCTNARKELKNMK